eukprot:gene10845-11000_t
MKARAARKREALLASLGMVQVADSAAGPAGGVKILPSPAGVPASSPLAAELAALDESSMGDDESYGGACMVCREGYGLNPGALLGCYAYCRVAAAADWPGCSPPWGTPSDLLFTTVSHFNVIHVACHAAAKAADASLRQPKRHQQWAGHVAHQQWAGHVAPLDDEQLYAAVAPTLRLYGVVSWLQQWAKQSLPAYDADVKVGSENGSSSHVDVVNQSSTADWSRLMAAKLQDLPACSEAAKQLLEYVERAERALGLQEQLDDLDLMALVVQMNGADHANACQDFVRAACAW